MKRFFNIGVTVILILVLIFCMLRYLPLFPIKTVQVEGDYWHISDQEIIKCVAPDITTGYFNVDIHRIQQTLIHHIPWIDTISVTRVWPSRIVIRIFQKKPVALWNHHALIDQNFLLFYPLSPTFPEDLPVFEGNAAEEKDIAKQYQQMLGNLNGQSFYIEAIRVSQGEGNWEVTFSNHMAVMLGNHDILSRFKHFITIYQQLASEKQTVPAYVDMRYSHGVAVKWVLSEEKQNEVKAEK